MGRLVHVPEPRTPEEDARLDATLRAHRTRVADPVAQARSRIPEMLLDLAVRSPESFRPPRTEDVGRVTLALARHLFGSYRTPAHLDAVWSDLPTTLAPERPTYGCRTPLPTERQLRLAWTWVTAASGGSVHAEHMTGVLSRRETHAFLTVPGFADPSRALWYVISRGHGADHGNALRIARSRIADPFRDHAPAWWREVARFFARNPARDVHQVDDLIDYMASRAVLRPGWSPAGRTLRSMVVATEAWHRELARARHVGTATWRGVDVADHETSRARDGGREFFELRQITSGRELAAEGTAMRHCVSSYVHRCVAGSCSVWSLRRMGGSRILTIELSNAERQVVQVRGKANRQPHPWESGIIDEWRAANGLTERLSRW